MQVNKSFTSVYEYRLPLAEGDLCDIRRSSIKQEAILLFSDKYKYPPQSVILGYPTAFGKLLAENHWRVSRLSTSTVDKAPPYSLFLPPAITKWVGVVTAAGHVRFVGIGGRSLSHFTLGFDVTKLRRVSVAVEP